MKHFYFKLIPPRSTFPADITPAEAKLMQEHSAYWRALLARNIPIVFGPVFDPRGPFGVCILRAEGEEEARALAEGDPTIMGNAGFRYELHPMPSAVYRE
jgi:hypothetical protein